MRITALLVIFLLPICKSVAEWNVGFEITETEIYGKRTFDAPELEVPFVDDPSVLRAKLSRRIKIPFFTYSLSESSTFKVRYTDHDPFITLGHRRVSPPQGPTILPIPDFIHIKEELEEYTLSYLYKAGSFKGIDISLGPTISYFVSDHTITISNNNETPRIKSTNRERLTEYKVGFEGALSYEISDRIKTELTYRFSSPTERNFHHFSLSISYKL